MSCAPSEQDPIVLCSIYQRETCFSFHELWHDTSFKIELADLGICSVYFHVSFNLEMQKIQ